MNTIHKTGKLKNRLNRLKRRIKDAPADKQGSMTARMREIEDILRESK